MGNRSNKTYWTYSLRINAVALLVLLPRSAWAGFVASHFRLVSHHCLHFTVFFAGRCCTLVGSGEFQRSWPACGASLLQALGSLLRNHLQVEQRSNRRSIDAIEHFLKQVKTLLLVFDQ